MTEQIKILIDLDLTLFNTDWLWHSYLYDRCKKRDSQRFIEDYNHNQVSYNLLEYFEFPRWVNGFDFWKEPDTYKNCNIHDNAVEVIKHLYEAGCQIIFCSHCMNCIDQIKYKSERLTLEFHDIDYVFIPLHDKGLVKADIFIDDRNSFLNMASEDVMLIKYDTPYTQDEILERNHSVVKNWLEIEDLICNYLEENV